MYQIWNHIWQYEIDNFRDSVLLRKNNVTWFSVINIIIIVSFSFRSYFT